MRTYFCVSLLLLGAAGCSDRATTAREFDADSSFEYIRIQLAFGPRVPNSEGHRKTGDWILERLRSTTDSVEVQEFTHETVDGVTLHLRNFIGRFRPEAPDRVLFVAHWDTRPKADQARKLAERRLPVPGANDGASGVALLLGVADALKKRAPAVGLDLLFVDGEDYGDFSAGKDVLLGSRHYAAHLPPTKPSYAIVWDMVADKHLVIYQEGHSVAGAPEVVRRVWTLAEQLGFGRTFKPTVRHSLEDDHIPLQEAGIRAIEVVDFEYPPHHTLQDDMDKVSAESLDIVGEVALALTR